MCCPKSVDDRNARPVAARVRADLQSSRQLAAGRPCWIVKDPVALRYFRFDEHEHALLQLFDGQRGVAQICRDWEQRFQPLRLRPDEVQRFLTRLHDNGLVVTDTAGQGDELQRRAEKKRRQQRWAWASNLLAIRFRGYDPQRLLDWLQPRTGWIFSRPAIYASLTLMIAALVWVLVQFDRFQARLPALSDYFQAHNLVWLMLALAVTKIAHELGHAVACRHYGGECHEIGAMLLVFTPCLYCNTTDSWMLPDRWRRIAISAAGMYVELVLASVATFVWWFTEPGLLNFLALDVMLIASVSTLLFNSNPLLKYDGYYILSDLVETPNLAQKSSDAVRRFVARCCLGRRASADEPPIAGWLVGYGVASAVYRWLLLFSILWFLHQMLEPLRLQLLGQALALVSVYGLLVAPAVRLVRLFCIPGSTADVKPSRALATGCVALALVVVALWAPLPQRVFCPLELRPRDAVNVFTGMRGQLIEVLVEPGQQVAAGQPLARLSNDQLDAELLALEAQRAELAARMENLSQQRFGNATASLKIRHAEESLAAVERQIEKKRQELARTTIVAPVAGVVLPAPDVPPRPRAEGELATWHGSLLEPRNLGVTVDETVLLCRLGDPRRYEAVLVVDQADVEFVRPGQPVALRLDQLPHQTLAASVQELAKTDMRVAPRGLSNKSGGELATRTDAAGVERPLATSYQARVFPIDDEAGLLRSGLRGRAKISTGSTTAAAILSRYARKTFNFEL